jgi:hypothetical protein
MPSPPANAPGAAAAPPTATPIAQFQTQIDALNGSLQPLLETPRILSAGDSQAIQTAIQEYATLNATLQSAITSLGSNTDIGNITTNIGTLQGQIETLKQRLKETKEEAETSEARKRSVENTEQDVSFHQLYLIDRPLRQLSIPTLFTLSVVFLIAGIYFLYKINAAPVAQPSVFATAVAPISGIMSWFGGPGTGSRVAAPAAPSAPAAPGFLTTLFKNTPKIDIAGRGLSTYFQK